MPAFGMTTNKSQGQTPDRVGIFLPEPIFGHGQLSVALSFEFKECVTLKLYFIAGEISQAF